MKILIVGINYAPEMTGIGPYTTELAEGLHKLGHRVQVFTGVPHYPEWRIADGYDDGRERAETINGVEVLRFPHYVPSDTSLANRLRMELSFGRRVARASWGEPDVVISVTPPLVASGMVAAKAKVKRVPLSLIVQDLYGLGMRETRSSSRMADVVTRGEAAIFKSASQVAVIHSAFKATLMTMRLPESRVRVIRNWSHFAELKEPDPEAIAETRAKYGWQPDDVVILHTGNMGQKQGLENVVEAARFSTARESKVRFVLVGDGNQRAALSTLGAGIANLQFVDPLPGDEYGKVLAAADLLLLNELPGVAGMAVPSKLTTYFAAGRPVIGAVDLDGISADEIRAAGAGRVVAAGDPDGLLQLAAAVFGDKQQYAQMCESGPRYAREVLSIDAGIRAYDTWCADIAHGAKQSRRK